MTYLMFAATIGIAATYALIVIAVLLFDWNDRS